MLAPQPSEARMTARSKPPFRAEHIGSLLRPARLLDAFRALKAGKIDSAGLKKVQEESIREAICLQEEIGLEAVTDGEFRRTTYISHFVESLEGLTFAPSSFRFHSAGGGTHEFVAPRATGRIRRVKSNSGEEFDLLKATTRRVPKMTLPSPATMHFLGGADDPDPAVYPSLEACFDDLARAYREDIADLARRGARYVQLDDVPFAMLCDESLREQLAKRGKDPNRLVDLYIDLTNACLAGRPADMVAGFHICRGNLKGTWLSEGGYDAIAEKLFKKLAVDVFFLEYDTARAGGFAPLGAMPEDKSVILGLVSSKSPVLERADDVKTKIREAARHVPLERLGLSPQCGFSSAVVGNPVTTEDQAAKLRLVVEVARDVWR
jgi:5-methyltetrahydropteroyltriglutamate--homocysteine methyltransferase